MREGVFFIAAFLGAALGYGIFELQNKGVK
ncbi:hypothetical protein J2S18_002674 [Eubacterium multiforme]|uniref:Uncharacterized protein n=1 Tax=Eubacterium multiforme TaxID=83339 RepID=A0ABT9UWL3_9FIRM|nr:hypothetical protein [Eubacterium multiforme]